MKGPAKSTGWRRGCPASQRFGHDQHRLKRIGYLNADFVSRYLLHVAAGTKVRLLGRNAITQLVPAVEMMRLQQGLHIEVRFAEGFHDRWLFLDGIEGYHSSASFHDGAKKAPTLLTPVLDVFAAVKTIYESAWAGAVTK